MKNQNQNAVKDTGINPRQKGTRLVDEGSLELVKMVVRCMAVSPTGMEMAKGAISVLDSLELWQDGETDSQQAVKADMEMIEWLTRYLFTLANRRGMDISIDTTIRHESAFSNIGEYGFDIKPWGKSWSYRPKRKESGESRIGEWEEEINPERIRSFLEPPTKNRPATADQSTTER